MTKTEAAEIIATDVVVFARQAGVAPSLSLCEERVSEYRGDTFSGTMKGKAAVQANPKTVWSKVKYYARLMG